MLENKQQLQHALDKIGQIKRNLTEKTLAFFLDYDGTLTPIVDKPELAILSKEVREYLKQLSQRYMVAVISGRKLSDVRQCVAIDTIYYSGNHGLEWAGPNHYEYKKEISHELIGLIDSVFHELNDCFHKIEGIIIENKKFSLSVHYRLVNKNYIDTVEKKVDDIITKYPALEKHNGKKVFELRPKIDWNKGKIVFYLLQNLNLSLSKVAPIYLGDDVTDEDAFRALQGRGVTILVSNTIRQSAADFYLTDPEEVVQFLKEFL